MERFNTIVRSPAAGTDIHQAQDGSTAGMTSELDGTWIAEDAAVAGVRAPQIIGHHLTFDKGRFRITLGGRLLYGGQFSLDPDVIPRQIDFDQSETEVFAGTWHGIYAIDGDRLTICDNAPDMTRPRPAGFDQTGEQGYVRVTFRRQR